MRRTLAFGLASLLLATTLAVPLVAADTASDFRVDCGDIMEDGLVPVTLCFVNVAIALGKAGACIAWRLLWGQSAPCPIR